MSVDTPAGNQPRARLRDSERSKRALLKAGTELFAEKGYSRARLRDIAERAGLDAALVIRYFGSKEGLYRATLDQDDVANLPLGAPLGPGSVEQLVAQLVARAMNRWESAGIGPLALSLSRPDAGEETRIEVRKRVDSVVEPLAAAASQAGVENARLRAELAVAALVGAGTIRSLASLDALTEAQRSEVETLLRVTMTAALTG